MEGGRKTTGSEVEVGVRGLLVRETETAGLYGICGESWV